MNGCRIEQTFGSLFAHQNERRRDGGVENACAGRSGRNHHTDGACEHDEYNFRVTHRNSDKFEKNTVAEGITDQPSQCGKKGGKNKSFRN